tara:strand:- start:22937 stop:23137 length:201 start_codon:yes stop_codon:yes gene_type:complete
MSLIEKITKVNEYPKHTNNLSPKEIGFLINMIEEMAISGKVLELAYSVKTKLQGKLNQIANKTEEF